MAEVQRRREPELGDDAPGSDDPNGPDSDPLLIANPGKVTGEPMAVAVDWLRTFGSPFPIGCWIGPAVRVGRPTPILKDTEEMVNSATSLGHRAQILLHDPRQKEKPPLSGLDGFHSGSKEIRDAITMVRFLKVT